MLKIPEITKINSFEIPSYKSLNLQNGVPVHFLYGAFPDVIKMDIVFLAGRVTEDKRAVSKATGILIKDGVPNKTSAQIAEELDYYGATLSSTSSMDTITLSLYCLKKYFGDIWSILMDILTKPEFPDSELMKYKSREIEKLKVELTKNDVVAYRSFTENIFGERHPYGYNTLADDYKALVKEDLVNHFQKYVNLSNCKIFLTGNVSDHIIDTIDTTLGEISISSSSKRDYPTPESTFGKYYFHNDRPYQSSIIIGRRLFSRSNSDYPAMFLLNTILGGYFGSRLIQNIRENKGYTYGIYSSIDMLMNDGYFSISTDVGNEYIEKTLVEIYKEIDSLKNKLVGNGELELVKNYIFGNMLSLTNGNLNSINLIRKIEVLDLDKDYFSVFLQDISNTNSRDLLDVANKYLNEEDFTQIIVGNSDAYNNN